MKNILAVDTSTKVLSVTLKCNNSIINSIIDEGFTHSEKLIPIIDTLLNRAKIKMDDIDLLVCTKGPGSFTGLRIGMSTLKGISLGLNIPLVSVPTLDPYGYIFLDETSIVLPVIDARKKCYYTSLYKKGNKLTRDLDVNLADLLQLIKDETEIILTGPDSDLIYNNLNGDIRFILKRYSDEQYGKALIELGHKKFNTVGPDEQDQGPTYIRKSDAEILFNNKNSLL
ncbi:MAG: tRNA (adenosine(37)-N6)-threonylcarbamoyltransferase complex dimerization subunit type 1 TsaB [Spirochaetaceae bacterium]